MTTKEQERKALEQIKKIIAGLGEGSYIATAMDGMIEDAEENIENDFAMSWKDRAENATKRFETAEAELVRVCKDKADLEKRLAEKTSSIESLSEQYEQERERASKWHMKYLELQDTVADKDNLLAKRDYEIMELKAKLYDLLVK